MDFMARRVTRCTQMNSNHQLYYKNMEDNKNVL